MHGSFDMKIVITKKIYSHMMLFPIIAMMSLLLSVYSSVSHETQKVKILPSPNSYKWCTILYTGATGATHSRVGYFPNIFKKFSEFLWSQ